MLIRLMPTAFFTDLGSRVLIAVAVMILALFSAAKTILMAIGKSEQEAHRMENAVCEA